MTEKSGSCCKHEEMEEQRRGPWTLEEDTLLIHYIACHGEGRWNLLARCSGLKRSGKSCRLRWLNYLKPDIKRGNLSPEEQFLILQLHSQWGNRWSRIAQHLPGRTDNEIKNYWRTRVQKQARQLKVDANSALFHDAVRCHWIPRLLHEMGSSSAMPSLDSTTAAAAQQENSYSYYNEFSSCSTAITSTSTSTSSMLPANNIFSSSIDEVDGAERLNPVCSGYSSMINESDQAVEGRWDPAVMASAAATSSHSATNYADGWWSMDELHEMLKSYMGSEAQESKLVPKFQ